ncbi:MAG: hypothetical protein ABI229_02195 [Gemmatimonadaceae bacterium]
MTVEDIPLVIGAVVLLIGLAIMWDAWGPQTIGPMRDRRRRARASIDVKGEFAAGLGIVLLGTALVGRDWRFETLTVLVGTIFVIAGALRNRKYFKEVFLFRGSARRDSDAPVKKSGKMRIR